MDYEVWCELCGWVGRSDELVDEGQVDLEEPLEGYCPKCLSGDVVFPHGPSRMPLV